MITKSPLQVKYDRYYQTIIGEWLYKATAQLGRSIANGKTIETGTPGVVWCRMDNGQEVTAYNRIAPSIWDTHLVLGMSKTLLGIWQVIEARENYFAPAQQGTVTNHASQHFESGVDPVRITRKQTIELSVWVTATDSPNFIVTVFGGQFRTRKGIKKVSDQKKDISAYVPTEGAVYVNLEADSDGVVAVHAGIPFASKLLATEEDIPIPDNGKHRLATIILFETMTALLNEYIVLPSPIEAAFDLKTVYSQNIRIEGRLAAVTKVAIWVAPQDGTMSSVLIYVDTPGSAGATTLDVNKNGTTIYTTSGNRPSVAYNDSDKENETIPNITTFVKGDVFTFDLDAVATGAANINIVPIITA